MYDINVDTASGPAIVRLGLPSASLFKFPPDELPTTLPAPQVSEPTWAQPFNIPPQLYNQLLDVRVPITIASVYAITVVLLNRVNKSRGYKPWGISQTKLFKGFVILHNVFLAIYSAWTFAGMFVAFRNSWPDRDDPNGLVGVTDALCKINGPRGYGNAATYDPSSNQWLLRNPEFKLAEGGVPDPTDMGRKWNEGLAYLGWIFYLSKFYEVLDTAIILAKGKKSSTLQTYHHAGAMMCMWAGIRYIAPPIWIFTLVNSGIHAMMYTYYTLTALRVRIPGVIKRSLTSMQILQFLFGTTIAASYLFVYYTLPPNQSVETGPIVQPEMAVEGAGLFPWIKTRALRAAGAEGIAKNVGSTPGANSSARTSPVGPMVPCTDTSGQAFAIWLNVSYLLPLTYLFVRFFVRSYLYRKDPGPPKPTHMHAAEKAGLDALKGVSREIQKSVEMSGETSETTEDETTNNVQKSQPNVKKPQQDTVQDSPVRTRASAKQKARVSNNEADQGFSTVTPRKGAKKVTQDKLDGSPAVDPKGKNPFQVLDRDV
ncbi:hypothetical protein EYZ11_009217 [Aspergillus tanneri]|uniref:Elongation of fatty acids protein n=1 Tax=Aspergillus tanneri TaxID=1220188 RepID=A0A4S3J8V7_9EURO|nr:uncharacterized protein ATNIH1004_000294 [Aspergillus tanneri]KAA8651412.1 hypothetical protein ATNIH1004_000294 [Aspergillus tanneri]THC91315.1 hypothetical protein EYZ11_009217 [Aspergillus tanneri]